MITKARDGDELTYQVHGGGAGAPMLVLNGLLSTHHHWPWFLRHYGPSRAVVTWDYRGHGGGAAPKDPAVLTVEQFADDAAAVARAAGGGPFVVVGLSYGVQVALEIWRRHPSLVKALVLICGTYGHPFTHLPGGAALRAGLGLIARGIARSGGLFGALLRPLARTPIPRELAYLTGGAHRDACPREVLDGLFAHVAALDPRVIGGCAASYLEHTAEDVLPSITVPTLIVAGDRDQLTPVPTAEKMHRAVPGSRLVVFPGHSHLVQVEKPDAVHAAIDDFLVGVDPLGAGRLRRSSAE